MLQLLLGRKHRGLGPAQPDAGPTVPRAHGRRLLHRHLGGRNQTVDRRPGQHGPKLGLAGRPAIAAARLQLADILARILSHWGMVSRGYGELERGGSARGQAGQVSAALARELRAQFKIRRLR